MAQADHGRALQPAAYRRGLLRGQRFLGRQNGPFPGASAISKAGNAACDNAFRSYVGVGTGKSIYTWTNIIPDAATWPTGDRALHCIAYYATPGQPAGVKLTGSIRESRK